MYIQYDIYIDITIYSYLYAYIQRRQYPTWSETTDKDEKSGSSSGPRQQVLFFLDDFVAQQLEIREKRDIRERNRLTHPRTHIQQSNTKQTDTHLSTGTNKGVGDEGEEQQEEEMSTTYNINNILLHKYVYIIESIISRVLLVILSILHIHTDTYTNIYQLHPTSIDNDTTITSITTNTNSITTATIGIHKLTSAQKIAIIQLLLLNRNYNLAVGIMTLFGYTNAIAHLQKHLTTHVIDKSHHSYRCDDGCNIIDVTLRFSIHTLNEMRLISRKGLAGTDRYTREQS